MTVEEVIAIAKTLRPGFFCLSKNIYADGSIDYYIEYVRVNELDRKMLYVSQISWENCLQGGGWKR